MPRTMLALAALLLAAIAAGCGDPCDADQRYDHGLCYSDSTEQPGPDAGDAGGEDIAHFGDGCTETSQCAAPTDHCAVRPPEEIGYCTRTGCVDDASVCPEGWTCLDLSQFDPAQPSICQQP
jgi:hypothetical protein